MRDSVFVVRRPTILGSILIKARSLMEHADPGAQREDLLRLLSLLPDPRASASELGAGERQWLVRAGQRLDPDGPSLLEPGALRTARLAHRLLIRQPS